MKGNDIRLSVTDTERCVDYQGCIFAVGPLTGLSPLASKTVAMFKSPHIGNLGESHCGGRSAVAIRMAGYRAIIISGKRSLPVKSWKRYRKAYDEIYQAAVKSPVMKK